MDVVTIRPWEKADAEGLCAAIAESLPELRPWMPWAADEPHDAAWRRRWICERAATSDVFRAIVAGGEIAGGCGLHQRVGPGGLAIGYWVRTSCAGRGVARRAVALLVAEAFADPAIERLQIDHDVANPASGAVAAAAGFTHVGDKPAPIEAPAETGILRVWRLER